MLMSLAMTIGRRLFLRAAKSKWLASQVGKRAFTRRAVLRFMPGEDVESALDASSDLAGHDIGTILTQLGENVTTPGEAAAVREHYLAVIQRIVERELPSQVSVKPTHLGLDIAYDACLAHLRALAERMDAIGQPLWIDMEDSRYVEPTLELYRELRSEGATVGICLQAYLHRTPQDLKRLLPLKPLIRLVKGAYNEPAAVALPVKREVDERFFKLGQRLLEHTKNARAFVVFGTHDLKLVERLREEAARVECEPGTYEFHMLYGIKSGEQRTLAEAGERVRVLVSYGTAWFPWYMRRLAERPANVWFVVRSLLTP